MPSKCDSVLTLRKYSPLATCSIGSANHRVRSNWSSHRSSWPGTKFRSGKAFADLEFDADLGLALDLDLDLDLDLELALALALDCDSVAVVLVTALHWRILAVASA